jgi:hypothetical protein
MIGGFYDNNPTFTYVKVKGLTIVYNNISYPIMDMYTSCKYLYWDTSSPNILIETNIRPVESASKFLVCINNEGIHTEVPHDEITYNFGVVNGDGDFTSSSEFNSLKTQVDENTTKYSSMSSTVDSMAKIIGDETKLENGTIIQNLTTIKSNANSISAKVNDIQTNYSNNAEFSELRNETSSSLIALLTSLSTYHSDFNRIARKDELEEGDIPQLEEDLDKVNTSLSEMDMAINKAIQVLNDRGELEYVDELRSAFNNVQNKINTINNMSESTLSDSDISASDITIILTAVGDATEKINVLKATCDEALVLGLGGSLYESFSEMNMTNDRIQLTVSETYQTKKDASTESEIVSKKMSEIEQTLDGITSRVEDVEGKYETTLKSSKTMYYLSSSRTELKDGEWREGATQQAGKFIWLKLVYEYSDGSTSESTPVCIQGADGNAGEGTTLFTWIRYADDDKGTNISNLPMGKAYIGFAYNQTTATESNNPSDYSWSRMLGEKGDTGVQGEKGADGNTYYTWIKYSDNPNGNPCYDTPTSSTQYIGIATNQLDENESGDYTRYMWSKFKGDQGVKGESGKGISSITNYYLSSSLDKGITLSTSGWVTTIQSTTSEKKYLWNYEKVTYTDGTHINTIPCIIGNYAQDGTDGSDGADGKGIKSIVEYYQVSNDNKNAPTSWKTTPPILTIDNRYLWNYEVVTYTDDNTYTSEKRVIGVYGNTGSAGKGVSDIVNYYLASPLDSGVTTSTSGWTTTVQLVSEENKYLWNYEKVIYTDDSTDSTIPCIIGNYAQDGVDGNDGKSIESIVEYYQVSNDNINPPTDWKTTVQVTTNTNKYLWNYEVITYTDGTTHTSQKRVIGTQGQIGSKGQSLVSSTPQYYLSTSASTQVGGSWSETMPTMTVGKYMWSRFKLVWENPSDTTYTTPILDKICETIKGVDKHLSEVEQTANKISWLVKSGDSASSMVMTDSALNIIAENINLTGKVTFNSLDSSAQSKINSIESNANNANNTVNSWKASGKTTINGGMIETNTITANQLSATAIDGKTITGATIIGSTIKNSETNPTFQVSSSGNMKVGGLTGNTAGSGYNKAKFEVTSEGNLYSVSSTDEDIYTILKEGSIVVHSPASYEGKDFGITLYSPDVINGNDDRIIRTRLADGGITIGNMEIGTGFIGLLVDGEIIIGDRTHFNSYVYSKSYIEADSYMKGTHFNGKGIRSEGELVLACDGYAVDYTGNSSARVVLRSSSGNYYFNPNSNGATRLGSSSYKWASIWCSQDSLNTSSDRREKTNISYYDEDERFEKMFMELKPCTFQKTDSEFGRHHSGLIAQEVEEAMINNEIDYKDFGALLKIPVDKDGEELNVNNEEQMSRFVDYQYGLRYGEFTGLNIHMIQKAHKEIDELKETVKQQQAMIEQQQKMIDELMKTIKKD